MSMSSEDEYEDDWETEQQELVEQTGGDEEEGDSDEYEDVRYEGTEGDDDDDDYEPQYNESDPSIGYGASNPAEYYQADYDGSKRGFQDEHPRNEKNQGTNRRRRIMVAVICCCCLMIAVALVLVLFVFGGGDDDKGPSPANVGDGNDEATTSPTPVPTPLPPSMVVIPTRSPEPLPPSALPPPTPFPTTSPAPTLMPIMDPTPEPSAYPTIEPSLSPAPTKSVPDELILLSVEDTYIVDGFDMFEPHGQEDTFLVQQAKDSVNEIPDSFALINFDMSELPFERILNRQNSALLELTHQVAIRDRGPATYTVERLPSSRLDIETLHLGIFTLPTNGVGGRNFTVAPDDETLTIDATDLLFGDIYEPFDDDQALFLIVNYGPDQQAGDRFKSREAVGEEPKLLITLEKIPGVPDSTPAPVPVPTRAPDPTPAPIPAVVVDPETSEAPSLANDTDTETTAAEESEEPTTAPASGAFPSAVPSPIPADDEASG